MNDEADEFVSHIREAPQKIRLDVISVERVVFVRVTCVEHPRFSTPCVSRSFFFSLLGGKTHSLNITTEPSLQNVNINNKNLTYQ